MLQLVFDFIDRYRGIVFVVSALLIVCVTFIFIRFFKPMFYKNMQVGSVVFPRALRFTWEHPVLMLLAVIKICIITTMLIAFIVLEKNDFIMRNQEGNAIYSGTALLILIIGTIVISFFSKLIDISAIHYTIAVLESNMISLFASIRKACASSWLLAKFVLLDYLIKVLTRTVQKRGEKRALPFQVINTIIASTVGLAWDVATYFITPVIAHERVTLRESIRRSAEIMKNNFGQTIGFQLVSMASFIVAFILILFGSLGCISIAALIQNTAPSLADGIRYFGIAVMLLLICIGIPIIMMLSFITAWIFKSAAYNYTQGKSAGPFYEQISQASTRKIE